MSKPKKKRRKPYRGAEAAGRPTIQRLTAVNRSRLGQWWFDHKRLTRPALIGGGVALVVVWLLYELVRLIVGD